MIVYQLKPKSKLHLMIKEVIYFAPKFVLSIITSQHLIH